MVSNQVLDDISEKITGGLRLLGGAKQEVEAQVRSIIESSLQQFDVVTDERMQVQEALLRKARDDMQALSERIQQLEARVKELEKGA